MADRPRKAPRPSSRQGSRISKAPPPSAPGGKAALAEDVGQPAPENRSPESISRDEALFLRRFAHRISAPLGIAATNLDFAVASLRAAQPGSEVARALLEARVAVERIRSLVARRTTSLPEMNAWTASASGEVGKASRPQRRVVRVLVVDDDPVLTRALTRALGDFETVFLNGSIEARDRIAQGDRFAFILCNLMMPELSGPDLYAVIERIDPEQADRMVFMTGGATTAKAREFVHSVPNLVLQKPVDVEKLKELMRVQLAEGDAKA